MITIGLPTYPFTGVALISSSLATITFTGFGVFVDVLSFTFGSVTSGEVIVAVFA